MSQYEFVIIDRREKFFEDSAKFRNDEHDFYARVRRGEIIQADMRARLVAGTDWTKIGKTVAPNVTYPKFGKKRA